jgi:hypothetical protein
MKAAGVVIISIVLLVGGIFGLRWVLAEPSGALEQREMTVGDGAYRIAAYEQFYDECAAAQTLQATLATAQQSAAAEGLYANRQAQLDANVAALSNQLIQTVNQYNADARKADTRAHFLASDLPYEITVDATDPTTPTITCMAE